AGEEPALALAPGTPRRAALDLALAEIAEGRKSPSTAWRREFSLLLGLERVLSEEEPKLADGTVLSAHQVDALSGTLPALLAAAQNGFAANGAASAGASPELLASADIFGPDDDELSGEADRAAAERNGTASRVASADEEDEDEDDDVPDDDEDAVDEDEDDEELEPVALAPEEDDEDDDFEDDDELLGALDASGDEESEQDISTESDDEARDWADWPDDSDADAI